MYHAKYLGKLLSFSDDVCVPVPRYQHFNLFEHDGTPAMWNNWFMYDNHNWLEHEWYNYYDFAQKQGYLNTYRTLEVEQWLESNQFGVFAIRMDALNNKTLHEMCIIFPRAWIVCITESRKLKTPFMLNQLVTIVPDRVAPYNVQWVHGIDQWISNRYQVMRQLGSHIKLQIDQSEAQAFFNTPDEQKGWDFPSRSNGYWGRKHTLRCTLEPESEAIIRFEHDGILLEKIKFKREQEFYFRIIARQPIVTLQIWQENCSHSVKYNPVMIKSFEINDKEVKHKGIFYPKPSPMIRNQYNPHELKPKPNYPFISMDGYWEIKTDGLNML
jgi:hypothetical protein